MIKEKINSKGQAVVEFVLLVGVMLIVGLGVIDYGMYMSAKYNFENATRNAVRNSVKMKDWSNGESANSAELKSSISAYCSRLPKNYKNNLENYVFVTCYPNNDNIEYITVEIKDFPFTSLTGFVDCMLPSTLSSKAVMRYEF